MRDRRAAIRIGLILAAAAALVTLQALAGGIAPAGAEQGQMPPLPDAVATCAACHEEPVNTWHQSPHRRTVRAPQVPEDLKGCAGCHRGAAAHFQDVTVAENRPTLKGLTSDQISDLCLACHRGGDHAFWMGGSHSRLDQSCLACHSAHYGQGRYLLTKPEPDLCYDCHRRQQVESRLPSHHPIAEGKMVCSDCHNPHGDERGNAPEASNPELCFKCHAEKEGPFAYEHPPVTEDCLTCHKPHGSQTDNLLTQDEPLLCMRCHTGHHDNRRGLLAPFTTDPEDQDEAKANIAAFYTKCSSCHPLIHGTDLPSGSGNGTFMPGAHSGFVAGGHMPSRSGAPTADIGLWGFGGFALGNQTERDNQAYVREYDGKDYEVPDLSLSVDRYAADSDTHVSASGLLAGDEDASLAYGNGLWRFDLDFSTLTHRTGRFNDPLRLNESPYLPEDEQPGSVMPSMSGGTEEVFFSDLDNGRTDYGITRQLLNADVTAVSPRLPSVKWLGQFRRESESGSRQFTFLDRCDGCHKFQTTQPIDRVTTDVGLGLDLDLGRASGRYLHNERRFDNEAAEGYHQFSGISSVFNGQAPLFGVVNGTTRTDTVHLSGDVSQTLSGYALWGDRNRRNETTDGRLDIETRGGGLNWMAASDLLVSARHTQREFDSSIDDTVSRDRTSTLLGLRYAGLSNTSLYGSFEREVTDRDSDEDHIPSQTEAKIWTVRTTVRPDRALTLRGHYQKVDSDVERNFDLDAAPDFLPSRYLGRPDDANYWSVLADYTLGAGTLVSGFASDRDETWEINESSLGVHHRNTHDIKTSGLSLSCAPSARGSGGLSFYRQEGDTFADVRYGTATLNLQPQDIDFPPVDGAARFRYDADVFSAHGAYLVSPRLRLFGRWSRTNTDGEQRLQGLYDYLDQDPTPQTPTDVTWKPFDLKITDAWIGIGCLMDPLTEFTLTYQQREWSDRLDSSQDGTLRVWRAGVRKQF